METWHDKANNDDKVTGKQGDQNIRKSEDQKIRILGYQRKTNDKCLETKRTR